MAYLDEMAPVTKEWWRKAREVLGLTPDYSRSIKCYVCGEPVGRKGDSPVVKDADDKYRHSGCKRA